MKRAVFAAILTLAASHAMGQSNIFMEQAGGTSRNPESAPMPMMMWQHGSWMLMLHGQAFFEHADDSGARGGQKTFSTNWMMASASRQLGGGVIAFRTMLSLEPATIPNRSYPELFQTGETAYGKQLIDAQHPHDFFMELAAEYLHSFGRTTMYIYAAPVGEPALGPVAFPHRESASEIPQAPIAHHYEDSTHIAYDVVTGGIVAGPLTLEGSGFHGAEPDENRWDIDGGRLDSWSARARLRLFRTVDVQVSHGWLTHPEAVEPGYQTRTTASISYTQPLLFGSWSTTIIRGHVYKEVHDRTLDAWTAETLLRVLSRHSLTARFESADKDELFPHPVLTVVPRPALPVRVFRIKSYTAGYTFDLLKSARMTTGIGANVTRYGVPTILRGFYGSHPHAVIVFLRVRAGNT
jgi:hypothetical protein